MKHMLLLAILYVVCVASLFKLCIACKLQETFYSLRQAPYSKIGLAP